RSAMRKLSKGRWRLLPLLVALATGCDLPGQPKRDENAVPADKDFSVLYATHCAGCHGANGNLGPAPPLNDPIFLPIIPEEELLRVIMEGRSVTPAQKSPMPAFARDRGGPLTDAQVKVLADGIKERWPPTRPAPAKASGANKDEVDQVFARACAGCHGSKGK